MKVVVTGEREGLPKNLVVRGEAVEILQLEVLRYEEVEVDPSQRAALFAAPPDWIVFTSPRAVDIWKTAIGGLPKGSRLAAIGRATGEKLGAAAAFVPRQSGSESFFDEFRAKEPVRGKRFLFPGAEQGRTYLPERLAEEGGEVERLVLYRSVAKEDGDPCPKDAAAVVFTSPSSVEALLARGPLPSGAALVSMGKFTSDCLRKKGMSRFKEIPGGDLARLGEVL
jgi:uroporphyrinogen-III synthase